MTTTAGAQATTGPDGPPGDLLAHWRTAVQILYPPQDAEAWDQVGIHVGDADNDRVSGVLVALDVTPAVLDEAVAVGADLVVAHHPLLFSPLKRLTPDTASGRLALQAVRHGCAVIAAHTNVDKAADGTSHPVARVLDLQDQQPIAPLSPDSGSATVKVVTFVPRADTDAVLAAMSAAAPGVGTIGDYTECAFVTSGTGTFRPGDGANPAVGSVGRRQAVEENRVEMVMPRAALSAVRSALAASHPYEEVPIDVYPMLEDLLPRSTRGLGLIGHLPEPMPIREVARALADRLPSPHLRLATSDPTQAVTTVAVCGGAGDSLIDHLIARNRARGSRPTDVFVTGDLKHHVTLDALTMGLSLIDAGHFATENPAMDAVAAALEGVRDQFDPPLAAPVIRSQLSTDPWTDWTTTA